MSEPIELTRSALRDRPRPEYPDSGKTDHGYLVIVAGSRHTPGSALLCSMAALRAGVGQVTIVTVESAASVMSMHIPESKVVGIGEDPGGAFGPDVVAAIRDHAKTCGGVIGGPGMENSDSAAAVAKTLLDLPMPVVIDAGLLYSLPSLEAQCRSRSIPPVLLPHSVEMAAILGCSEDAAQEDGLRCARQASKRFGAVVLAKGSTSHIASPDGDAWTWRGGAPGLGVAGSGDTLAGIIGALLARGAEPLTAVLWGVLLHGEAGEILSAKVGPVGFLAREIPEQIPPLLAR